MHKKIRSENNILIKHRLRKTPIRIDILKVFLNKNHVVSSCEIKDDLAISIDRVLYLECTKHYLEDKLIHFNSIICHHTYCLNDINIPTIEIPIVYKVGNSEFTLQEHCPNCIQKKKKNKTLVLNTKTI